MDGDRLLELLLEATTLKLLPRAGWITHGVPVVESVAEHSFGVAFVALALLDALRADDDLDRDLDREKVLIMALLHDLAEVRLTDLPQSAIRLIPGPVKKEAQAAAVAELLAPLSASEKLTALWQEFEDGTSPEGLLVRDADKLEMMIQCLRYELAGSRGLDEFWQATDQRQWHYQLCADLYARLKPIRPLDTVRET
jgi:putative hydrolase of HD superfamily